MVGFDSQGTIEKRPGLKKNLFQVDRKLSSSEAVTRGLVADLESQGREDPSMDQESYDMGIPRRVESRMIGGIHWYI